MSKFNNNLLSGLIVQRKSDKKCGKVKSGGYYGQGEITWFLELNYNKIQCFKTTFSCNTNL